MTCLLQRLLLTFSSWQSAYFAPTNFVLFMLQLVLVLPSFILHQGSSLGCQQYHWPSICSLYVKYCLMVKLLIFYITCCEYLSLINRNLVNLTFFFARFMHSKWIWCWWVCAEVVQICLFWLCWSGSCFMLSWSTRS